MTNEQEQLQKVRKYTDVLDEILDKHPTMHPDLRFKLGSLVGAAISLEGQLENAQETIGKLNWYRTAYNDLVKDTWRYSHDEIEAACGGEMAVEVRLKIIERRRCIDEGLKT